MIKEPSKVHADETDIDSYLVKTLLKEQFSKWQNLPLKLIQPEGTDNVMYQLGNDKAIRLPRTSGSAINIQKECTWLPKLAPALPIAVPTPLAIGKPSPYYPHSWAICRLLEGTIPNKNNPLDLYQAALDLGYFVKTMQEINSESGPTCKRGLPLSSRDLETRDAIGKVTDIYDSKLLNEIWESMLGIPIWSGSPKWVHGDLHAGNLLAKNKKLTAVVDFGSAGIGDPACDLMVAWTLLRADTRNVFQEIVQPDDSTWERGRAWAFTMGIVAYPYYKETNPSFAAIAKRAVDEIMFEIC